MEYSKADHALIWAKAALNAVPMVGSPIASLITDYVPLSSQRSLEDMMSKFAARLSELESRLDVDAVNKDEFSDLYKSCFIATARSTDQAKHRAAANILANIFLVDGDRDKLAFQELDHFTRALEALSSGALCVLAAAASLTRTQNIPPGPNGSRRLTFEQLRQGLSEIDPDLLMGLCGELHTYNLLRISIQPTIVVGRFDNYALELTSLGWRFVAHVLGT